MFFDKNSIWFWLVLAIALFAIYGTWGLVLNEYKLGNICPKILGIPACYIVLGCFSLALISHVLPLPYPTLIYFLAVGLVTGIAITGTLGELFGFAECPKTSGGIPMCFISLGICLSLLLSKYAYLRSIAI